MIKKRVLSPKSYAKTHGFYDKAAMRELGNALKNREDGKVLRIIVNDLLDGFGAPTPRESQKQAVP